MKPYATGRGWVLYHGDALQVLPGLDAASVVLVAADAPYHGVVSEDWDNQWDTDGDFLSWVNGVCQQTSRVIASNGSIYWFCSPRMAARVECEISKTFNVLNNICWHKGDSLGVAGQGIDVTALRRFWSSRSERIVFAEKFGADGPFQGALVCENQTYWAACEGAKRSVFGVYLRSEFERAGVTQRQIAELFPSASGGITGCVSNWLLGANCPTSQQYETIRDFLNNAKEPRDFLRREYEDLRREYEDLRREYEDLRRPFRLTVRDEWGDVWRFPIERDRDHPTQKPVAMMSHIIRTSSNHGCVVLDPFSGSGSTGVACAHLGRRYIGIEIDERWCEVAAKRLRRAEEDTALFAEAEPSHKQLDLGDPA